MIKRQLIKIHWFLESQLGFNIVLLINSIRGIVPFIKARIDFRKHFTGELAWMPCLHDRYAEGGSTKTEYFWQDLVVARLINAANPERHVDIGSRVDGFVAHVASFRELEVFDVRPITTRVPGVRFKQADLMKGPEIEGDGYCDSVSCLHALEHFGLGRYGDPLDPEGYEKGFRNMAKLLKKGGWFYLSTPIGRERVEFNANWVFDPRTIMKLIHDNGLMLKKLSLITGEGVEVLDDLTPDSIDTVARQNYKLGLFEIFRPINETV